jgi:hypothetical protein
MSVYKEGFHAIALIKQNSRQIYPDAADFGMLVKKGDQNWNWTKQLCDWYGVKETRVFEKYATGHTLSQVVSLMNEHGDHKEVKYCITYVSVDGKRETKGFDGYVYVEEL